MDEQLVEPEEEIPEEESSHPAEPQPQAAVEQPAEKSPEGVGPSSSGSARKRTGSVGPVLTVALIVSIGGVLGGCSHGFPSPTLLDLQEAYEEGERVTAFSSSSIYAGLFGVSLQNQPHPMLWLLAG